MPPYVVSLKACLRRAVLLSVGAAAGCAGNPYERGTFRGDATPVERVALPFPPGTRFTVRQGAFGKSSHREPGNEYSWDFAVPLGTPVLAAADGVVIDVWRPAGIGGLKGGCDPMFADKAWNIKVEHRDGTVAQYVHIDTRLLTGFPVKRGEALGRTALNGWLCYPHLHFGVYRSKGTLYDSPRRETLPVLFQGIPPDGIAREGKTYEVPAPD